jgi:chaperone modulatory protein CbpM
MDEVSDSTSNEISLTLEELSVTIHSKAEFIFELVEFELITPKNSEKSAPENWRFDSDSLRRAKTAIRFYRELEINMPGIALALDLLEKIEQLECHVELLKKSVV